ncbi:hypothetical protein MR511_06270 [bacterium]|nr:hypothetical protein [bacterium]
MEDIQTKINRGYSIGRTSGGPGSRYKSWEWCHEAFKLERAKLHPDIDLLSLHLAFYLASWGMYRGSSFLLDRDYKAHQNAVKIILEPVYSDLWDYDPTTAVSIADANDLIFGTAAKDKVEGVYWRIKDSYSHYTNSVGNNADDDIPSDTLVTKILLGTFACIPAFDRFLKRGISQYVKKYDKKIGGNTLTQSIESSSKKKSWTDSFKALAELVKKDPSEFKLKPNGNVNALYPPMKCVDMYFWEIGYELDMADSLNDSSKKIASRIGVYNKTASMGLFTPDPSFNTLNDAAKDVELKRAAVEIKNKNW